MRRLTITSSLLLALVLGACGTEPNSQHGVRARDLATGDIQTFSSEQDVPDGWSVCPDEDCTIPPEVACELLSQEVCELHPECRLRPTVCTASGSAGCAEPPATDADGAAGDEAPSGCLLPPPPIEECLYECVPARKLLCEELTDHQQCLAQGCVWGQGPCPLMPCYEECPACPYGEECDPACTVVCPDCPFTCRTPMPEVCENLANPEQCSSRPDCQWLQAECMAPCVEVCPDCEPGADCGPCKVECPPCAQGRCVTRPEPRTCEMLKNEGICNARPDCEWDWIECAYACGGSAPDEPNSDGAAPFRPEDDCVDPPPPCPPMGVCRPKAPETCFDLDRDSCDARPGCHWEEDTIACDMMCRDDGNGGCLPCDPPPPGNGRCVPDRDCPAIQPIPPRCENGEVVPIYRDGCLVGYECVIKPEPCPLYYPVPPECEDGELVPRYNEAGCLVGWDCVKRCAPVMCDLYCEYGYKKDDSGCEICECNEQPDLQRICQDLNKEYIQALQQAKQCNAASMQPMAQCTALAVTDLFCGCTTMVNPANTEAMQQMSAIKQKFRDIGCLAQPIACPAIACMAPQGGKCEAVAGDASNGTCIDMGPD